MADLALSDFAVKNPADDADRILLSSEETITPVVLATKIALLIGVWQDWTVTHGGFSVAPVYVARYSLVGKTLHLVYTVTNTGGTSSGTTYTLTLPAGLVAKSSGASQQGAVVSIINGGVAQAALGRVVTASGSNTLTLSIDGLGTGWSASSTKRGSFSLTIEVD